MSINWVMLTVDGKDIVPLDREIIFYRKDNVKFELDCSNGSSFNSKSGSLILTNQRVVYLCQNPNSYFATASMPISNIQDSKLYQPWFSSAVFQAVVMPVPSGGLTQPGRLSITFADGSLHEFDFQYRALKERLQVATIRCTFGFTATFSFRYHHHHTCARGFVDFVCTSTVALSSSNTNLCYLSGSTILINDIDTSTVRAIDSASSNSRSNPNLSGDH
ncbi:hypothetical protein BG003_005255 [Podila horticola]|nr:hypothetical protein BG003_005255 [Podila horticola]